ncbi:hypothetical protein HELRODRAFT_179098 [Helobdella robusta]|uniref:Endonuclease/exonuclease/phosphatase domain-containing protein n=1 Tax=Helobdella robusta TaxID=6412 RepID=T1FE57_HELRO|nr:hypothetical protein HELRODRAFT_179098 [Helobdella robusta]ESN95630.1 hypothetical protein HELRODRAFT_179098 [Helobdella robusta]
MEIAEMLERRRIDICCLQETRWKSNGVCHVNSGKEKYKLFWNGQKRPKMVMKFLSDNRLPKKYWILKGLIHVSGDLNGHVGEKTAYMAVLARENRMKMATASLSLLKVTGFVY